MTGKHAVGRVIARPFVGEPGNYARTPDRHDWSLKPRQPNYLTLVREKGHECTASGRSATSSPGSTSADESPPDALERRGHHDHGEVAQELEDGVVFVNLVETDMLWGHRNDPVNFHRCLQDFDRRLPDLLGALRDGDLLIITSDHGCDPDAVHRPLARACAAARLRRGGTRSSRHDGEFGDVGATVNRWLGGRSGVRGLPGARSSSHEA